MVSPLTARAPGTSADPSPDPIPGAALGEGELRGAIGERAALGVRLAPSTVGEFLRRAGVDPAPRRDAGPGWAGFLRARAGAVLAADFVVIDLLEGTKAYVLVVIEDAGRRVRVLGATAHLVTGPVVRQARNLVMDREDVGGVRGS